jgi:hypothetical protein
VISGIAFACFLNWYDTGQLTSDGWQYMLVWGFLLGGIALIIEERLFIKYKFWPKNLFLFVLRLIVLCTFYIALGFALSSMSVTATEMVNSSSPSSMIQSLLVVPLFLVSYLLMILPFGVVAGAINGIMLRFMH